MPAVSTTSKYMLKLPFRRGNAEMVPVVESTSKRPGSAPSPAGTKPAGGVQTPGLLLSGAVVDSERQSNLYVYLIRRAVMMAPVNKKECRLSTPHMPA